MVKNEDLIRELKLSIDKPTEKLWMLFDKLVRNLCRKFYSVEYEDIISDAILGCILSRNKYNIEKDTSAFSYFSSLVINVVYQNNLKSKRRQAYNNRVKFNASSDSGIEVLSEEDYEFEKFLMKRKRQKIKSQSK